MKKKVETEFLLKVLNGSWNCYLMPYILNQNRELSVDCLRIMITLLGHTKKIASSNKI
jgi:hypothetical protein